MSQSNVVVTGPNAIEGTYKNIVLKFGIGFEEQTREGYCIYHVKWNYDLGGAAVDIPANVVISMEGGVISNGTLVGHDTQIIYDVPVDKAFVNVELEGTWIDDDDKQDARISELERISGNRAESTVLPTHMGRVTLKPNIAKRSNYWFVYPYTYTQYGTEVTANILVYFNNNKYYLPRSFQDTTPVALTVIAQDIVGELPFSSGANIEDVATALDLQSGQYLSYDPRTKVITMLDSSTVDANELVNDNKPFKNYTETDANLLTQQMISKPNTIYAIQYDFELATDITVPANCVLEFDGGSISGIHTLTGNNTGINTGLVKIFNTDVTLAGSWNVAEAYPEWFGAKGDGTDDDSTAFQCVVKMPLMGKKYVKLSPKTYVVNNVELFSEISIVGCGEESKILSMDISNPTFFNSETNKISYSIFKDFFLMFNSLKEVPALDFYNSHSLVFEGIGINASAYSGNDVPTVRLKRTNDAITYLTRITKCKFIFSSVYIESTDSMIINNIFNGSYKDSAVILYNCGNTCFENNQCVAGSISSLKIDGVYNQEGLKIIGNYFDGGPITPSNGNAIYATETITHSLITNNNFWQIQLCPIYLNSGARYSIISNNVYQECGYIDETKPDVYLGKLSFGLSIVGNCHYRDKYNNEGSLQTRNENVCKTIEIQVLPSVPVYYSIISNNVCLGDSYNVNPIGDYYQLGFNINQSKFNSTPVKGGTPAYNYVWDTYRDVMSFKNNHGVWVDAFNYELLRKVGYREDRPTLNAGTNIGYPYYDRTTDRRINWNGTKWVDERGFSYGEVSGVTQNRPSLSSGDAGYCFFDKTLGKPIYWNGTAWVDATGTTV